ncbi:Gfo/Idh/MocA family oxidoreductase [Halorubellus sp. JP-L1]|uniref:Gfo/Idh/MocA family protein n=1 Tax=Halorubellus sp. JP-L1 TaxID=2715753 RepID=UPI00140A965F|nr:Gfo/Idh/MocA family oxidoreductase [Halorubellus sp. JP-L1]NHN43338.1 Gfo/Idh/MocA family oxidoreductase [Halorubellus sp. JP-L1]
MTTSDALSVGFLGYRFMGKAHANALARLPMFFPDAPAVERDVLVGTDEDALDEWTDRLGFERYATDWRDVVDDVDVLYNLAPNFLHVEPTVAALEAGTHVLCEKPLAPTLAGAERMRDAARESDAVAGCAFNYRFVPAIQYARNLIASGDLGEIRQVRGSYLQDWLVDPDEPWSWRNDAELAGSGALGDLGAHTVDLASFLVGDRVGAPERVSGHLRTFVDERPVEDDGGDGRGNGDDDGGDSDAETKPVTVDDAYSAQVEYESGAMGTFEASRMATGHTNDHSIAVHGTDGSVRFSLERLNELEVHAGDSRGFETVLVTDESDPYVEHWWPPGHVLGWEHTFVHENAEFLAQVPASEAGAATAVDSNVATFDSAFDVQRVLDAVAASDDRGEWVRVDDVSP